MGFFDGELLTEYIHTIPLSFRRQDKFELYCVVSGMISSCKAAISEVSDDSNQALGITIVGAAWGIGYIVGPAVSGAIADPIGQYNLTITSKSNLTANFSPLISLSLSVKL